MRTLHGDIVNLNDVVFDVSANRGVGNVVAIGPRGIEVSFPSGTRASYNHEGVQMGRGRATLFWHNPVIAVPMKSNPGWAAQRALFHALQALLKEQQRE